MDWIGLDWIGLEWNGMEKDAFDVAVFYWHTIMTYSSILSIAHTGHCNREYIFKGHKTGQSLKIRKCLK